PRGGGAEHHQRGGDHVGGAFRVARGLVGEGYASRPAVGRGDDDGAARPGISPGDEARLGDGPREEETNEDSREEGRCRAFHALGSFPVRGKEIGDSALPELVHMSGIRGEFGKGRNSSNNFNLNEAELLRGTRTG